MKTIYHNITHVENRVSGDLDLCVSASKCKNGPHTPCGWAGTRCVYIDDCIPPCDVCKAMHTKEMTFDDAKLWWEKRIEQLVHDRVREKRKEAEEFLALPFED